MSLDFPYRICTVDDWKCFRRLDLEAYDLARWRFHYRIAYPGLYYQRIMRDVELCNVRGWAILGTVRRVFLKIVGIITGISIPPGVFGPGLSIPHVGSIVVNDKARAGAFCRVHSATNIGEHQGAAPLLGSYVYVGPGAVLYGGINVGDDSVIGANSVVNCDVASGHVVAGSPARTVGQGGSASVMPLWIAKRRER